MSACAPVDACRCPLCGGPNRCAMASAAPAQREPQDTPCWCTRAQFSVQLLQQVPEAARGLACICPDCVKASQAPA